MKCANPICNNNQHGKYCSERCRYLCKTYTTERIIQLSSPFRKCIECGCDFEITRRSGGVKYCKSCRKNVRRKQRYKWEINNPEKVNKIRREYNEFKKAERKLNPVVKKKICRVCNNEFVTKSRSNCKTVCSDACRKIKNRMNYDKYLNSEKGKETKKTAYKVNSEKIKNRSRIQYYSDVERGKQERRDNYLKHKEKYLKKSLIRGRDKRANITDEYIKELFKNKSGVENPTSNMIEQKRLVIKIKRIINEKQREIHP
jgi:hypothetical protein